MFGGEVSSSIAVRCLLGICILVVTAAARERPLVEASWEELPPLLEGREIETVLLDGVRIKGRVLKVAADSIEMRVSKSSDPTQPRGERRIRRELFGLIGVKLRKGPARALLTAAGIVGPWAILAAKYHAGLPEGGGARWVFAAYGLPIALGVIGYHLGARLDDKSFDVKVIDPGARKGGARRDPREQAALGSEHVKAETRRTRRTSHEERTQESSF